MINLPQDFINRMKDMLGEEYSAFLGSYEEKRRRGLRVNTMKISPEDFRKRFPYPLEPVPWAPEGFVARDKDPLAAHPFYTAGLFYLQEPSAMTPAAFLPIEKGDRVLDLCAAPGGKSTQLAARLGGTGLLISNDNSRTRARALLRNLELFGTRNAVVTCAEPADLAMHFRGFFDKVLVDAPCSGEGMFRKSEDARKTWSPDKVRTCAAMQRKILESAVVMLRPGGLLMYSTCTFSPEEDEGTVSWLLENYPEMEIQELPQMKGFSNGNPAWGNDSEELTKCVRIWPHKVEGEGHFLTLLRKNSRELGREPGSQEIEFPDRQERGSSKRSRKENGQAALSGRMSREEENFLQTFFQNGGEEDGPAESLEWLSKIKSRGGRAFLETLQPSMLSGIEVFRNGLFLGEWKKGRFEPSQPLALALTEAEYPFRFSLAADDPRLGDFLKGLEIHAEDGETIPDSGWVLICAENHPIGWAKAAKGRLKNKYPAAWRKN
ncbi:MAG: RsmB/NOP family class I SAM-dependent RNA methyltransferase [Eubacterium sp.]|nr:RsmB/NOP family class I SAM-dependent RNA methyltransferase [Eubacterium sp.]